MHLILYIYPQGTGNDRHQIPNRTRAGASAVLYLLHTGEALRYLGGVAHYSNVEDVRY